MVFEASLHGSKKAANTVKSSISAFSDAANTGDSSISDFAESEAHCT